MCISVNHDALYLSRDLKIMKLLTSYLLCHSAKLARHELLVATGHWIISFVELREIRDTILAFPETPNMTDKSLGKYINDALETSRIFPFDEK